MTMKTALRRTERAVGQVTERPKRRLGNAREAPIARASVPVPAGIVGRAIRARHTGTNGTRQAIVRQAARLGILADGCNTSGLSIAVGDDGDSGREGRTGSGDG